MEISTMGQTRMTVPQGQLRALLIATAVLMLCFCVPLYELFRFALGSELYSYILLLPFVSAYLVWIKKPVFTGDTKPARGMGVLFFAGGMLLLAGYWLADRANWALTEEDVFTFTIGAFYLLLISAGLLLLGRGTMRGIAFPLALLVFMVPAPTPVMSAIETGLQYGSAFVTDAMLRCAGTTFTRDDLLFFFPNLIPLRVAPECSGIHSTLILFITSLIAGHLFLRSRWKQGILALAVIPLALLRNGFRIFTIAELCVHVGQHMINHWIHKKGGPVFFALSLIPFFALLWVLFRSDRKTGKTAQ